MAEGSLGSGSGGAVPPHRPFNSFWGKAGAEERAHPAICHMIDVAEVAGAFLERPASRALIARLASPFGLSAQALLRLARFLCAAHDIGKISPGFEQKRPDLAAPLRPLPFPPLACTDHCQIAVPALKSFLVGADVPVPVALDLARTLAGHHGLFPAPNAGLYPDGANWEAERRAHLDALAALYQPDFSALVEVPPSSWLMTLAGLVSVSDWIGSAKNLFP